MMSFALIWTAGVNESAPMRDAVNVQHDFNQSTCSGSFTHLFAQVYSYKHMQSTIYTGVTFALFQNRVSIHAVSGLHWELHILILLSKQLIVLLLTGTQHWESDIFIFIFKWLIRNPINNWFGKLICVSFKSYTRDSKAASHQSFTENWNP